MITSYLKQTLRNFKKSKLHTSINIIGLSLGLTASILAYIFVVDEFSFDKFHANQDRLYRLNKINKEVDGSTSLTAESSGMMGPTMVDEFPEVEKVVRYAPWYDEIVLSFREKNLLIPEQQLVFADSTFFQVFSFPLRKGDPAHVLDRPQTIVLTEPTALAIFGDEDPIGKMITGMMGLEFEVTGVAEVPPSHSHIQFAGVMSWTTTTPNVGQLNFTFMNNWIAQAICTYVLLKDGASQQSVDDKFHKFMKDHLPERVDKYALYLQPFSNIYLESKNIKGTRMAKSGNIEFIRLFSVIAGFILCLACVNYVNISTSKATRRAKEVGVRKSLGAQKSQLIFQFLSESIVLTSLASVSALLFLYVIIPYFNDLSGKSLQVDSILDPRMLFFVIALTVIVSVISGLYPSFVLSAFKPASSLKGTAKTSISGNAARYTLITFQFVISIVMIAATLIVYEQIDYVLSKDLGFDKERTMVVNLTDAIVPVGPVIQEQVNAIPEVVSTSLSRTALGHGSASTYIVPEGFGPNEVEVRMFQVDFGFQKTYGLEMVMGRFFDPAIASDSSGFVINEALMRRLNWSDPIQKTIRFNEGQPAYPVIGVLKDFHFKSLYEEVEPLLMWIGQNRRNLSIRFSGNPANLLAQLESTWRKHESRYPFQYYFVDDAFAKNYEDDGKLLRTTITFSIVSILIAALGLYGLVSFTIEQRTKEFGIRKVLGATLGHLNFLVNKTFIGLVLIASAIAIPIVIPLVKDWLAKFAFHVDIGPGVFVIATFVTLFIAVASVSLQAIRVSRMNPVDSLRHE